MIRSIIITVQIVASVFVFSESPIAVGPYALQMVMITCYCSINIANRFLVPSCAVGLVTMKYFFYYLSVAGNHTDNQTHLNVRHL